MARKTKTIKFMLEFEKPEKGEGLSVKCPVCKAPIGEMCHTKVYGHPNQPGGNRMSDLHHDRYAVFMNLDVIHPGSLYRIKG